MSTHKLAVIGGGAFGFKHIESLYRQGLLGAVCEPVAARRDFLAEKVPGVPLYGDLDNLLTREAAIRGVVIATPPHTHHALALQAMRAGRDCLVEKPMTIDPAEARELVDTAAELGRVLMVGHLMLYTPAVLKLRALIAAGELGEVHYLHSRRVKLGTVRANENVLWSFAPHDIAVQLFLLDEIPSHVACSGRGYVQSEVADVAFYQMRFASGRQAHIQVGWLEPDNVRRLVAVGSKACAVIDELSPTPLTVTRQTVDPVTLKHTTAPPEPIALDTVEPLAAEIQHFVQCIETRAVPRSSGQQGLMVVHLLDRATQSLHRGGDWMSLDYDLFC
jgi:UDP-2-acetamido-3-amino-2,3-dideoxy-glucuronate N-acetyltransferase